MRERVYDALRSARACTRMKGNGRTRRAFLTQIIGSAGHSINFVDTDTEALMIEETAKTTQLFWYMELARMPISFSDWFMRSISKYGLGSV